MNDMWPMTKSLQTILETLVKYVFVFEFGRNYDLRLILSIRRIACHRFYQQETLHFIRSSIPRTNSTSCKCLTHSFLVRAVNRWWYGCDCDCAYFDSVLCWRLQRRPLCAFAMMTAVSCCRWCYSCRAADWLLNYYLNLENPNYWSQSDRNRTINGAPHSSDWCRRLAFV